MGHGQLNTPDISFLRLPMDFLVVAVTGTTLRLMRRGSSMVVAGEAIILHLFAVVIFVEKPVHQRILDGESDVLTL